MGKVILLSKWYVVRRTTMGYIEIYEGPFDGKKKAYDYISGKPYGISIEKGKSLEGKQLRDMRK